MASNENTFKRDLEISIRHRKYYPSDFYCTDIDFLEVKYDKNGKPIPATVWEAKKMSNDLNDFQMNLYRHMGVKMEIPAFFAQYTIFPPSQIKIDEVDETYTQLLEDEKFYEEKLKIIKEKKTKFKTEAIYKVEAINSLAEQFIPKKITLNEKDWIDTLRKARG